jgi:hypothetical protein
MKNFSSFVILGKGIQLLKLYILQLGSVKKRLFYRRRSGLMASHLTAKQ